MFLFREVRTIAIGQPPNCNSAALICTTWCRRASHGTVSAEYTYRGMPLPQQDDLRLVENELSRRYQAGDKAAELKPAWPEERRHI